MKKLEKILRYSAIAGGLGNTCFLAAMDKLTLFYISAIATGFMIIYSAHKEDKENYRKY